MPRVHHAFRAMASRCELLIEGFDPHGAAAALAAAEAEVRRIEAKYSRYRSDSLVAAINRAAGSDAILLDEETASLVDFAAQCWRESEGRFDPTSGVLRRAWDFTAAAPPRASAIERLLPLIGWSQVEWSRPRLRLPRPSMELDFGGFGKEYAVDRASAVLIEHGASHALVNLGGDVRAIGTRADGSPWQVGIRHPRRAGATIASMALADAALATSGDYERYLEHDGQRYSHLLDPRTGWPVEGAQSASVVAPVCLVAGALASMAMLDGDSGYGRLRRAGVAHLWIDRDGVVLRHPA